MIAGHSATSSGRERVRNALGATVTMARLATELIGEYANTMGTGQWLMARTMAEATLRIATTVASNSMSRWTAADAQEQALITREVAENALRYIQKQVRGGQRHWGRAAAMASATVTMATEAEEKVEEGWDVGS
jgi:hypothetical protein